MTSDATQDAVMAALVHEADLDGFVMATGSRLSELCGLSQAAISTAIRDLAVAGRITVNSRARGVIPGVQILDGAA